MRVLLLAACAAFVAACSPVEEVDVMSEGCDARGFSQWAAGAETFSIEATTVGPDCARAVATLVVRNSSGEPIYADVHIANHVMTLATVQDPAAMQTALTEWVDTSNTATASTDALPEWAANAEAPSDGEFPFYPEEGHTRESYAALRAANYPMFCYVQGMESLACITFGDGGIERIGVQTFPG
jgi:hypothetical protein